MKRSVCVILILIMLCVLCSGCDSWMGGEYLSVTPHEVQPEGYTNPVIEVTSYTQLRNAVENLVRNGASDGIISISAFNKGTIHFYVDTAISNVIEKTAFGSYAVEKITYDIGTNRGVSVVACKVHYRRGYQPLSEIREIGSAQELSDAVVEALEGMDQSLLVYMEQYEKLNVEELVAEHTALYPDRIIEIPKVAVNVYPEKGAERIVEISFGYEMDQIRLQQMRRKVEEHFRMAEDAVRGFDSASDLYEQLYYFLIERCNYKAAASKTPAYTLFVKGEGDAKAFADVYARLCTRMGLGCKTVSGTRNGQNWAWNSVQIRGEYYYVDLLRCFEEQKFQIVSDTQLAEYEES